MLAFTSANREDFAWCERSSADPLRESEMSLPYNLPMFPSW
jgi:hypothetical protein